MTIVVQCTSAETSKDFGLVETYMDHIPGYTNHNFEYKIPIQTIDNEIANMVKQIESTEGFDSNLKFNPHKHIIFDKTSYKTTKTFTLSDLNITKAHIKPINNFGASYPFELFSREAVNMLLWEAFQPAVIENFSRLPNLSKNATRLDFHIGGHLEISPFTNAVAKSEELAEIVSTFVGHKMKHVWDTDLVHINVSLASSDNEEILKYYSLSEEDIQKELEKQNVSAGAEVSSTTGVHYDSISVPLVIMLDLPKEARGGQTTIITGDEKTVRVPDPPKGSGTVMQGRVLRHLASKPVTNHNRISFVISYGTGVEGELDNCVITSVKPSVLPKNEYNKFYRDWVDYKLGKLEAHLQKMREDITNNYECGIEFNQEEFVGKCGEIVKYIRGIYEEMECVSTVPYPPPHFNLPYAEL